MGPRVVRGVAHTSGCEFKLEVLAADLRWTMEAGGTYNTLELTIFLQGPPSKLRQLPPTPKSAEWVNDLWPFALVTMPADMNCPCNIGGEPLV